MARPSSTNSIKNTAREAAPAIGTIHIWPVYSYLIVYRAETDPLEVVRVLHGARDVRRILDG